MSQGTGSAGAAPSLLSARPHAALPHHGDTGGKPCTSPTAPLPTTPNATIIGTVVERVDGPPYSFLRLDTEKGQVWVAVPKADVPNKAKVTVKNGAVLKDFESKQAGRKFEAVVFGVMDRPYRRRA